MLLIKTEVDNNMLPCGHHPYHAKQQRRKFCSDYTCEPDNHCDKACPVTEQDYSEPPDTAHIG